MGPSAAPRPPRLFERLLETAANRGDAAAIAGDVAEEFVRRVEDRGRRPARIWYGLFVLRSLPSFVRHSLAWSLTMFRNYVTIALRVMKRQKVFSFINVAGLAVGLACSIMIGLYVVHESAYDRFHEKAGRIFRVCADFSDKGQSGSGAWTPPPLAKALVEDFPEVEAAARYSPWPRELLTISRGRSFLETGLKFADASFFELFTYRFIYGDPRTALAGPRTIVISRTVAEKYFGHDNPLGEILTFPDWKQDYQVTGVIEDPPARSHFQFTMLASLVSTSTSSSTSWGGQTYFTYILLREGASGTDLEAKLPEFTRLRYGPEFLASTGTRYEDYYGKDGRRFGFLLEPLQSIHLNGRVRDNLSLKGNAAYLKAFSAVALFILLIAGINFMNLATARFAHRSREVGVRKVLGSRRGQLVAQFLGESLLLSAAALVLGLGLIALMLPAFGRLVQRPLVFGDILSGPVPLLVGGLVLLVGLAAGGYPALFLSSFRPQATLKGPLSVRGRGQTHLRRGLVLVQFAVGFAVIFGTGVIARQMDFLGGRDLGFDKDQVVVINRAYALGSAAEAFEGELLAHAEILKISRSESLPGRHFDPNGHVLEGSPATDERTLMTTYVDDRFADLLGLRLAEGRFFSREVPTDATSAVVINETAVRELGLSDPVGKRFHRDFAGFVTVIGVLEDFHFDSLHHEILPMLLRPLSPRNWRLTSVKVRAGRLPQALELMDRAWNKYAGGQPFQYSFLDSDFAALYDAERRAGRLFTAFSALAILVACLGLYGLVSFAAERRTREIGIRKTFGASTTGLAGLLSRETIVLVGVASVIASPPALYFAQAWLRNFAFRAPIQPWMFIATGATVMAVAFLSVAFRAIRAAAANPAETLRYE